MKHFAIIILLVISLPLTACSMREVKQNYDSVRNWVFNTQPTAQPFVVEDTTPIIEINYDAADCLYADLWLELSPESPIYYTFFTDLANPEITAPFGRVVTEQVAARLAQKDYKIVSGQARKDDYTTPEPVRQLPSTQNKEGSLEQNTTATDEPELSLSEQFRPIWPCIMTGDYLIGDDVIFISARINTIRNNQLISSYQWTVPINQNTRTLLPQLKKPQRGMRPTVQTRF